MKNIKLNARQQALVNEYYEYGKTVVVTNFHFADGKELSTGYSLEDAYQEAAVALCIAAAHFNADRGSAVQNLRRNGYPQPSEKGNVF